MTLCIYFRVFQSKIDTQSMFAYFHDVYLLPRCLFISVCRHFEFRTGHVTLGSVQYGQSVQYARGLLHAALAYGTPIHLTLIDHIHHEIKFVWCLTILGLRLRWIEKTEMAFSKLMILNSHILSMLAYSIIQIKIAFFNISDYCSGPLWKTILGQHM